MLKNFRGCTILTRLASLVAPHSVLLFVLATPVQFISGWQFYVGTYRSIKTRLYGMDVLICLGTSASYFYACLMVILAASSGKMNMGSHFFETSAVLISFVLLGKYLQAAATRSTSKAIDKLCELTPGEAQGAERRAEITIFRHCEERSDEH